MRGEITRILSRGKGERYGFIRDEEGNDRYFEQRNVIGTPWGDLIKGSAVEFQPTKGGRDGNGLRADKVRVVG